MRGTAMLLFALIGCSRQADPSLADRDLFPSQLLSRRPVDHGPSLPTFGPEDCTRTQGYWKNHTALWPVSSLSLGDTTYSAAECEDLFDTPTGGDASLILAHQLMAAKLNVEAGADDTEVAAVIEYADDWLYLNEDGDGLPFDIDSSTMAGSQAVAYADVLDAYNNGDIGPGHCDDDGGDDGSTVEECDGVDDDGDGEVDEGCFDECPEPVDCLSVWQAHAKGVLTAVSDGSALGITFTNLSTTEDVCIDSSALYTSPESQAFFVDQYVLDDEVRLLPGTSFTVYYGSYTTNNGYYAPYLGQYAWWCFQTSQAMAPYKTYAFYGAEVPWDLIDYVQPATDTDSNGRADRDQWYSNAVLSQNNLWNHQAREAVMTVGKLASSSANIVTVTLTVRNIGVLDGTGYVSDTVPAGWSWLGGDTPEGVTGHPDGSVTLDWTVDVLGYTSATTTGTFTQTITYTMGRDIPIDLPYLELDPASVDYYDGAGWENSVSLYAAVYDYDFDGDGTVTCD